jgi:CRISPR/Cas system-associated protein Cas10 (large subunit of type III CRISPR-Cas system)
MNACYSINRKAGYVTVYNTGMKYPLKYWQKYKTAAKLTHQEVANLLTKYYELYDDIQTRN